MPRKAPQSGSRHTRIRDVKILCLEQGKLIRATRKILVSRNKFMKIAHRVRTSSKTVKEIWNCDRNFSLVCVMHLKIKKRKKKKCEVKMRGTKSAKMPDMSINIRDYHRQLSFSINKTIVVHLY